MSDLSLHEAFSVLTADELAEIQARATREAEALKGVKGDPGSRSWAIVFTYVANCAAYALTERKLADA